MNSPDYNGHIPDELLPIFTKAEADILRRMAKRLADLKGITGSSAYWIYRMQELGRTYDEIVDLLLDATDMSRDALIDLLNDAGVKTLRTDDAIHRAAGGNPTPLAESPALQNIIWGGYAATMGTLTNMCYSAAWYGTEQFAAVLDTAWFQVSSGLLTYDQAIKVGITELARSGIAAVEYISESGHHTLNYLDTVVRRAVLSGVNKTACDLQMARMSEMGCMFVETTAHLGARPSHALWQGRIFQLVGSDLYPNFYTETGYGTGAGLGGWNCRHGFYPYYPGISEPANDAAMLIRLDTMSMLVNGEPMSYYDTTQAQRYNERTIRAWKRRAEMLEAAGEDNTDALAKVAEWQARQRSLIAETGLRRDYKRERAGRQYAA
ncbi:phage minor capsid protein [Clostridia bacterium OttesenSCG-928-O13]|nr:phage minor capsid protein [Clostridia bacterium OttesenSCG-928-O13]